MARSVFKRLAVLTPFYVWETLGLNTINNDKNVHLVSESDIDSSSSYPKALTMNNFATWLPSVTVSVQEKGAEGEASGAGSRAVSLAPLQRETGGRVSWPQPHFPGRGDEQPFPAWHAHAQVASSPALASLPHPPLTVTLCK